MVLDNASFTFNSNNYYDPFLQKYTDHCILVVVVGL